MKFIYRIFCSIIILGVSLFAQALDNISSKGAAKLDKIIGIIKEKHIKTIPEEQLIEAAANGILTSLDSYSYFYNNKTWEEINTYTLGEFSGVGIEMKLDKGKAIVITPLIGSPAANAGILSGDRIISINGTLVEGMSEPKILKALLGKSNTKVSITVVREGNITNPIKFSIIRKKVKLPSVESKLFSDGVFYLRIGAFYENTSRAMKAVVRRLNRLQNTNKVKGLIIDLRNNPGGLLEQAINIASFFIEKGNLVSIFSPKMSKNIKYLSKRTSFRLNADIPIAVLINKGTASAAEVLAGALQDYKRATIIGEKSFGKGSVQIFVPLEDGEAISITTALYKTPKDTVIEKIGIIPDINVSDIKYRGSTEIKNTKLLHTKINKKEKDDFFKGKDIIEKAIMIMTNRGI